MRIPFAVPRLRVKGVPAETDQRRSRLALPRNLKLQSQVKRLRPLLLATSLVAGSVGFGEEPTESASGTPGETPERQGTLRLHFRGAPLEMILDYLSEAAGFIIS